MSLVYTLASAFLLWGAVWVAGGEAGRRADFWVLLGICLVTGLVARLAPHWLVEYWALLVMLVLPAVLLKCFAGLGWGRAFAVAGVYLVGQLAVGVVVELI